MEHQWVDECLALNVNGKGTEAINVMRQNLPDLLYKYRPLNDFTLESLDEHTLYMCRHDDLNDPYEFHPKVSILTELEKILNNTPLKSFFTNEELNQIVNNPPAEPGAFM